MGNKVFIECFGKLKDPRIDRTKKHLLLDIIALSLCAVMAGAQGWEEIEDFGNMHKDWLSAFLKYQMEYRHTIQLLEYLRH